MGSHYKVSEYDQEMQQSHTTYQSREDGKDQESIQSCTTPDPEQHMEKWQNTRKHNTQESQEVFLSYKVITRLQGTDKTA